MTEENDTNSEDELLVPLNTKKARRNKRPPCGEDEKHFECKECGNKFRSFKSLGCHLMIKHNIHNIHTHVKLGVF